MALTLVGAGLSACSSSSANPPASTAAHDSTTSQPAAGGTAQGGSSTNPRQTVLNWFSEVNGKNRAAAELLAEPYRTDWTRTRSTVWPQFSNVNCQTQSQTSSTATVHCTLSESVYAGESHPPTYWNFNLTSQSDGTWLITHYKSG